MIGVGEAKHVTRVFDNDVLEAAAGTDQRHPGYPPRPASARCPRGRGGSTAAVTTKKVSNVDQVFAANVLIGSGQFQGNHHTNKVSDDSLWHFADL